MPRNRTATRRPPRMIFAAALTVALAAAPAAAPAQPLRTARSASAHSIHLVQRAARRAARLQLREKRIQQASARRQATRSAREAAQATRASEREQRRASREAARATREAERAGDGGSAANGAPGTGEGAAGSAGPARPGASAASGANCALSAEASAPSVTVGEAVTISGKLTCDSPEEGSGQEVTVYQREAGASARTPVGTATTAADGSYQFHSAALKERTLFQLETAHPARHARVLVQVQRAISIQGPAASGTSLTMWSGRLSLGANIATIAGTVEPGSSDLGIGLKIRYAGEDWRTVAVTHTDAEGHYSFRHRFRYAGEVSVMVVAHPHGERRIESAQITYTIVQAQNPALTIATATHTPAPLGAAPTPGQALAPEPTTIAGVAGAASGRSVTLRARILGTRFSVPVAKTVTTSGGAYTFTVEPSQTTFYEVSDGRERSTPVRVEVS